MPLSIDSLGVAVDGTARDTDRRANVVHVVGGIPEHGDGQRCSFRVELARPSSMTTRARAAFNPAAVRSLIMPRSNSASAAMT